LLLLVVRKQQAVRTRFIRSLRAARLRFLSPLLAKRLTFLLFQVAVAAAHTLASMVVVVVVLAV
jgi:hypothetical protein